MSPDENGGQKEAIDLDQALGSVDPQILAELNREQVESLKETLAAGSEELLRSIAVALLKFRKGAHVGWTKNKYITKSLIDLDVIEEIHQLGAIPVHASLLSRHFVLESTNPVAFSFINSDFTKFLLGYGQLWGLAGSISMLFFRQPGMRLTGFELLSGDEPPGKKIMAIIFVIIPFLIGLLEKEFYKPIEKLDQLLAETDKKVEPMVQELCKMLELIVYFLSESNKMEDDKKDPIINAKIALVRKMVEKAMAGEDPELGPEEYGGGLKVGSNTINREVEGWYPKN